MCVVFVTKQEKKMADKYLKGKWSLLLFTGKRFASLAILRKPMINYKTHSVRSSDTMPNT